MRTQFKSIFRSFQLLSNLESEEEDAIKLLTLGTAMIFAAGSPEAHDYMREPRPCKRALEAFLNACRVEHIHALVALMYAGRDGQADPIAYWADELAATFRGKEDACRAILEKSPRLAYINSAIEKLPADFDLDGLSGALTVAS